MIDPASIMIGLFVVTVGVRKFRKERDRLVRLDDLGLTHDEVEVSTVHIPNLENFMQDHLTKEQQEELRAAIACGAYINNGTPLENT